MNETADLLRIAHARAQRAFTAMLDARSYGNPNAIETRAYVNAERIVDEFLVALQWEVAKAALDELQAADGDHHVYPAGVGR